MHQLLLLRHAKSSTKDVTLDDFDRPLAKRGRRDCKVMAKWLNNEGIDIDLLISSPAIRAKETTRRLCKKIAYNYDDVLWEDKVYGGDVLTVLKILAQVDEDTGTVMLVGHHEALDSTILRLSDWADIPADPKLIPTGAIARFELKGRWADIKNNKARLVSITKPRELVSEHV